MGSLMLFFKVFFALEDDKAMNGLYLMEMVGDFYWEVIQDENEMGIRKVEGEFGLSSTLFSQNFLFLYISFLFSSILFNGDP